MRRVKYKCYKWICEYGQAIVLKSYENRFADYKIYFKSPDIFKKFPYECYRIEKIIQSCHPFSIN